MAWVAVAVAVVGTAVSAEVQSEASHDATERAIQQNTYEGTLQQAVNKMEADDIKKASHEQAAKILSSAQYFRSAQAAQSAASGVLVGEGSSQVMQDRTTELAMQDALAALYSGARGVSSSNMAGEFAKQRSEMASASAAAQDASNQTAIRTNEVTSILSAGASAYGSYSKANAKKAA